MNSSNLSREQARALKNKIGPMLAYLGRLNKRMTFKGFPPDDPLLAAIEAETALHELDVATHYLALSRRHGFVGVAFQGIKGVVRVPPTSVPRR